MLIDATNSGDRNVIKKEAEKILKYEDPITEYQHSVCNVKAKLFPVITGKNGTISKSLRREGKKLRNCKKKEPYWALNAYCGKC
jgi:hypothetical protein